MLGSEDMMISSLLSPLFLFLFFRTDLKPVLGVLGPDFLADPVLVWRDGPGEVGRGHESSSAGGHTRRIARQKKQRQEREERNPWVLKSGRTASSTRDNTTYHSSILTTNESYTVVQISCS